MSENSNFLLIHTQNCAWRSASCVSLCTQFYLSLSYLHAFALFTFEKCALLALHALTVLGRVTRLSFTSNPEGEHIRDVG